MAQMVGYMVRATEAAIAFVAEADAATVGVKPLWIPLRKIEHMQESDAIGRKIQTAQDGERVGTPCNLKVCDAFLAKILGA
jgi:hypothetical protein